MIFVPVYIRMYSVPPGALRCLNLPHDDKSGQDGNDHCSEKFTCTCLTPLMFLWKKNALLFLRSFHRKYWSFYLSENGGRAGTVFRVLDFGFKKKQKSRTGSHAGTRVRSCQIHRYYSDESLRYGGFARAHKPWIITIISRDKKTGRSPEKIRCTCPTPP